MAGPDGEVTLGELRGLINKLGESVAALRRYGRANRAAVAVVLAVALGVLGYGDISNADTIHSNCEAGNRTRAQNVRLWTELLAEEPGASATPGDRAATVHVLQQVRVTFAPRHCP
jgi:hypothetical protein